MSHEPPSPVSDPWSVGGLAVLALVFGVLSAVFLFKPALLFAPIGLSDGPPALWSELRSAHGSFFGTAALLFAIGARQPAHRMHAMWLAMVILGGFVLGRSISILLDGMPSNPVAIAAFTVEAAGCTIAAVLWRRLRLASRPRSEQ